VYTLGELAQRVQAELVGDAKCRIDRVATLTNAGENEISFLANSRYKNLLGSTKASAVIVSKQDRDCLKGNGLIAQDPYVVYAKIAALLYPEQTYHSGIHPSSVIAKSSKIAQTATIGANCTISDRVSIGEYSYIGPGTVIEENVVIGSHCRLLASVTLCHGIKIGDRVIIQPGAVIGGDGFGLANENGVWLKIPQVGSVVIGNDVEIGSNTTIDRGAIEDTIIEDGVKLDNLIQIGHNVRIGAHTAVAASAAIAGSAKIGKHCQIAGMAGIVGHIEIADNVHITGMSVVSHSIREPGVYSSGTPLQSNSEWQKNAVRFKQLDQLIRRIKILEKQLNLDKK